MENSLNLEAYVEKRCLTISVRFAKHSRKCPKCGGNLTSAVDIVQLKEVHLRYLIFCFKDSCSFWIALFERMPSDYRTFEPFDPINNSPLAS